MLVLWMGLVLMLVLLARPPLSRLHRQNLNQVLRLQLHLHLHLHLRALAQVQLQVLLPR